ncbi:MAG: RNA polymerase sigma factor [Oscillospiraceae bacterium]|nr:RNA polymerase sigma factor [Oscillospiraceae bacterium]
MTDHELIDLYFQRSEDAIAATKNIYGAYCNTIISRIVGNTEDTEECISDVLLRVWNAIPPEIPKNFKGWIGCIARNCAITLCKKKGREPERIGDAALELSVALNGNPDQVIDATTLGGAISQFLSAQKTEIRIAFLRRYWYGDSLEETAIYMGWSIAKTKTVLFRTRRKLKDFLQREGIMYG